MKRKPRFRNQTEKRILRQLGIIPRKEKPIGYITIPPKVPEKGGKIKNELETKNIRNSFNSSNIDPSRGVSRPNV